MVYNLLFWLNSILKMIYKGKVLWGEKTNNGMTLLHSSSVRRSVLSQPSNVQDALRQRDGIGKLPSSDIMMAREGEENEYLEQRSCLGFESCFCHFLVLWHCWSSLAFLSFNLLTSKWGNNGIHTMRILQTNLTNLLQMRGCLGFKIMNLNQERHD